MAKRMLCFLLLFIFLPASVMAEYETLTSGDTGEQVRQMQQRLRELALLNGKADGIYGKQTAAAVAEAQRLLIRAGYVVEQTGIADSDTLALLFDSSAEAALKTLSPGSKGDRVRELQNRLIELNFSKDTADGAYGSKTKEAVVRFQQTMTELGVEDLATDGIVTPDVWRVLMSDLSQYGYLAPVDYDSSMPEWLIPEMLYAKSCILIDAPTGEVLFQKDADTILFPASTTKIMTLLLALEAGRLDETIIIPQSAANVAADSSLVPVYPGEQMQMYDLLHGLMIRSGNDAANAVAELICGSQEAFVQLMNQRAGELGMLNTHFVNPHGYHDENHYSTARDLATLTRYGLTDPQFCRVVTCLEYTLPATEKRSPLTLQNTNEIFDPSSEYYIDGAAGVKSGYTSHAGFCYVGAVQRNGRTFIAVILGVPGRNRGWLDLKKLFDYGFAIAP